MSTTPSPTEPALNWTDLHNGDRMTQPEFHRLYGTAPAGFRAELIGGVVYVASPLKIRHGKNQLPLGSVCYAYEDATPGTESGDNTTVILGEESEPQPDLHLRILPEYAGQSSTTIDDYVGGAPELAAEIAHSSHAIDLHSKRRDYARYGLLEYLVVNLRERKINWFDLRNNQELRVDPDGVLRVRCMPGLWIDVDGILTRNFRRSLATLDVGLATPEHTAFVERLAAAHRQIADQNGSKQ